MLALAERGSSWELAVSAAARSVFWAEELVVELAWQQELAFYLHQALNLMRCWIPMHFGRRPDGGQMKVLLLQRNQNNCRRPDAFWLVQRYLGLMRCCLSGEPSWLERAQRMDSLGQAPKSQHEEASTARSLSSAKGMV